MITLRQARARLAAFFRKPELDLEFDDELTAHIELATQDHLRQGMNAAEARRLALIKLGGIEPSKEMHRESRGLPWLDGIVQDVRHAFRGLRRSPGFTLTAIATLAIGIGVNAAVFTLTNAVLFKGFPQVRANDRLVYISPKDAGCCPSYAAFLDWRAQAKSYEGMAIVHGVSSVLSDKSGFPESYETTEVSADTFKLVGQQPILGRDFTPADETPGADPVAILSYGFWERRFAKDPAIVGQSVRMNGAQATVIGVMARGFSFPQRVDLWVPLVKTAEVLNRENRATWFAVGRLAKGATLESARAEMAVIGQRLAIAYPVTDKIIPDVVTFRKFFIGSSATLIYQAMWGAVGFVLLIACANLANLLLARAVGRSREISLRIALGAGRWRILRQLLIESLMLSSLGGILGWWIAQASVRIYTLSLTGASISSSIAGSWFDNVLDYSMDDRVWVYLIAISVGTGLLFGLAPASRLSKLDVNAALKDGGRGATGGGSGKHLSTLLVVGEMALAMVLLAGAGLMIRSFLNITSADMGFQPENLLATSISLPNARYPRPEARMAFYDRLEAHLRAIPGVESATIASYLPGGWSTQEFGYEVADVPASVQPTEQRRPTVPTWVVSPSYFSALGAGLLSGREFSDADGASSVPVVIVNQRFAAQHWPGENALGKRLRIVVRQKPEAWMTIVGIAPNLAQNFQNFDAMIYLPYTQRPLTAMWAIARTRVPPEGLFSAVRREVQSLDSELPAIPAALSQQLATRNQFRGFTSALFLIFAAIALLLASVGLYAVIAHSVNQRTQEIGIRMAVGASAFDILQLVCRQGLLPLGIGLAIGLAGSLTLNRLLQSELVQVSPADPITLAAASLVLLLSAILGCLIPARRAMRVDPVVALRHE